MRRSRFYIVAFLIALVLAILGVRHVLADRHRRKRESEYAEALRSFSTAVKTGMTRKQVEEYFSASNTPFTRLCCFNLEGTTQTVFSARSFDDLVRIGQEKAPWYCSEKNVYVAFQFLGAVRHGTPEPDASDELRNVTIRRMMGGCL